MTNIRSLVSDPEFQKFPIQERIAALQQAGADAAFIDEYSKLPENVPAAPSAWESIKSGAAGLADRISNTAGTAVQGAIDAIPPGTIPGGFDAGVARGQNAAQTMLQAKVPEALQILLRGTPAGNLIDATGGTGEGALELAPAVASTLGLATAGPPGAAAGASIGESVRQGVRGAAGLPQATGLGQQILGMDPNGPAASALGQIDELLMTPIAHGISKVVSAASKGVDNSALRDLLRLLKPTKAMDKADAMALAERMRSEGVIDPLSTRLAQVEKANLIKGSDPANYGAQGPVGGLVGQAGAAERSLVNQGVTVPTAGVEKAAMEQIPATLPGGEVPAAGTELRNAAEDQAWDTVRAINYRPDMPIGEVLGEKRRLDEILRRYYLTGGENVPVGKEPVQVSADAWRNELSSHTNPEVRAASDLNMRESDMITITELLQKAEYESRRKGLKTSGTHIFGMVKDVVNKGLDLGPIASLTAAGKTALGGILKGGSESIQGWLRAMSPYAQTLTAAPTEQTPVPAPAAPSPTPSGAPDEEAFVNKYWGAAR